VQKTTIRKKAQNRKKPLRGKNGGPDSILHPSLLAKMILHPNQSLRYAALMLLKYNIPALELIYNVVYFEDLKAGIIFLLGKQLNDITDHKTLSLIILKHPDEEIRETARILLESLDPTSEPPPEPGSFAQRLARLLERD